MITMGPIAHLKTDAEKMLEHHYDNGSYSSLSVQEKNSRKTVEEIPEFYDNENYGNEFSGIENDDDYDNEDLEEFYLSSEEEYGLLHEFVQQQKSID